MHYNVIPLRAPAHQVDTSLDFSPPADDYAVINNGEVDRINLTIDVIPNNQIIEILNGLTAQV